MFSCGMSVAPVRDRIYYGKLILLSLQDTALANKNNVFSCGMSVAPVTDCRYYGKLILPWLTGTMCSAVVCRWRL